MSDPANGPLYHGRTHPHWGTDPIPTPFRMLEPQMMGLVAPYITIDVLGKKVRLRCGVAYRARESTAYAAAPPFSETTPLVTGTYVRVDYFQQTDVFDQLSVRVHEATGLLMDDYNPREPWESDPWFGMISTTGSTLSPLAGNWQGYFYTFAGVSNFPGDTVHFAAAGGAFNADEMFGFDTPSGHVGYYFHNFTTSDTGNVTITFGTGSGSVAMVRNRRTITGTIHGSMLGETDETDTRQAHVVLTGDVPTGDCLIVMVASEDDGLATDFYDSHGRPVIWDYGDLLETPVTQTPHYFSNGRWWPILTPAEGRGSG